MDDDRFRAPSAPDPSPPAWPPAGWTPPPPAGGRPALLLAGLVFAVFVTFSLGVSVGQGGSAGSGPEPTPAYSPSAERPDWRLLDQAYDLLDEHYVDPKALDPLSLERGALVGMAESLDDRGHTRYLTPEEVKARDESLSGTYVGVGVVFEEQSARMVVIRVLHDSPAEGAGMTAGDEIVTVDGVSVAGLTTTEVAAKVRGPEGSKVTLELKGAGGATRSVTITRAKLDLPLVSWAFAPGSRDAVIRLESFSAGAAKAVAAALQEALDQGAEGVVLDLRGNPGGYVNEPVETAALFLEDGVVYRSVDRSGKETTHPVEGTAKAPELPLVVLVDDQTASSAEILTGALQDAGRARIVGVKTYGTGTVVSTFPLKDGGALTIGTERWLTPKGRAIWREGLMPDEVVELPDGAAQVVPDDFATLDNGGIAAAGDAQLKAALAALGREQAGARRLLDRAA
ncbi:MAG TPA: S41 family peptidase [Candidatus Nanopelagicales bacterium]|nr:S41 family peptidase [Candidatus Nanopelagicales bacterium]